MGAVAAAAVIAREKHLVAHFQQARAVSAASARSLGSLGVGEGVALRRLRARAVIREADPGMFYLDVPSWVALRHWHRRFAMVMLAIVVILGIGLALFTLNQRP